MTRQARPEAHLVLGLETSCDDTACAVVTGDGRVLSSVVSSQLAVHRPYGGVVPELASREHLSSWPPVLEAALEQAGVGLEEIDAVAATRGPGLVGSLLVGLSLGKAIAYARGVPFHPVHHLAGHLYSPFMAKPSAASENGEDPAPAAPIPDAFTALVVSGGHSSLYRVDGGAIDTLGETRDDAMGEAFDKVGKRLGLAYPQGPLLDRLAELGDPDGSPFPVPMCGDTLDLSYSGLKSQALLAIQRLEARDVLEPPVSGVERRQRPDDEWPREVHDLAAGFRAAAVGQLLDRLERLAESPGTPLVPSETIEKPVLAVSGGAAANRLLRRRLATWAEERGIDLRLVALTYSGDNAAMIAHAALVSERASERAAASADPLAALAVEAQSRIPLGR